MATWEALGLTPSNDEASDDVVWTRLRHRRNGLLLGCDWTQVDDAPVDKAEWAVYRQALRDLPDSVSDPREAVWPEEPSV